MLLISQDERTIVDSEALCGFSVGQTGLSFEKDNHYCINGITEAGCCFSLGLYKKLETAKDILRDTKAMLTTLKKSNGNYQFPTDEEDDIQRWKSEIEEGTEQIEQFLDNFFNNLNEKGGEE